MTNYCYRYDVYNMYRGGDPVKLNLYCRKRIIRNRLFHKGRMYWVSLDVLRDIHEIYTTVIRKIHRTMRRIVRFAYKSVMAILRLDAPIRVAIMVAFTALYGCALIALL